MSGYLSPQALLFTCLLRPQLENCPHNIMPLTSIGTCYMHKACDRYGHTVCMYSNKSRGSFEVASGWAIAQSSFLHGLHKAPAHGPKPKITIKKLQQLKLALILHHPNLEQGSLESSNVLNLYIEGKGFNIIPKDWGTCIYQVIVICTCTCTHVHIHVHVHACRKVWREISSTFFYSWQGSLVNYKWRSGSWKRTRQRVREWLPSTTWTNTVDFRRHFGYEQ